MIHLLMTVRIALRDRSGSETWKVVTLLLWYDIVIWDHTVEAFASLCGQAFCYQMAGLDSTMQSVRTRPWVTLRDKTFDTYSNLSSTLTFPGYFLRHDTGVQNIPSSIKPSYRVLHAPPLSFCLLFSRFTLFVSFLFSCPSFWIFVYDHLSANKTYCVGKTKPIFIILVISDLWPFQVYEITSFQWSKTGNMHSKYSIV